MDSIALRRVSRNSNQLPSCSDASASSTSTSFLKLNTEETERRAVQRLAFLYGSPQTYGFLYKKSDNSGVCTARVSTDKGKKRLPTTTGAKGKKYYLLPLNEAGVRKAYEKSRYIGKRPGSKQRGQTRHITIDIDRDSSLHPGNSLTEWDKLLAVLRSYDLYVVVVTSSDSGGLHILIWFAHPAPSLALARRITLILKSAGYQLCPGTLEVFPNIPQGPDVLMNGCRLPCLTPDSYPVDPNTLRPIEGWRVALVREIDAAIAHNNLAKFLHSDIQCSSVEIDPGDNGRKVDFTPPPIKRSKPEGFGQSVSDRPFPLASRFHWTPDNRSNNVIGAHVAYVLEEEGIVDPVAAEKRVWERLVEYGYKHHASAEEKQDQTHVRRWIACRLKRGSLTPMKRRPGRGDTRLNKQRQADSQYRLNMALRNLKDRLFKTATALWNAVNDFLRSYGLAGLGKGTFWKLKQFWIGPFAKGLLSPSPPSPRCQRPGQDDTYRAISRGSSSPPQEALNSPTTAPRRYKQLCLFNDPIATTTASDIEMLYYNH